MRNVHIVPKAAFSRKGKVTFRLAPRSADHRVAIPGIEHDNDYRTDNYYHGEITVEADTVDQIMSDLNVEWIDYIEVAVNGAELEVLRGMERMLRCTTRLFVKGHARDRETKAPIHKALTLLLKERGFHIRLTRPSVSIATTIDWGERAGDVYAWRIR